MILWKMAINLRMYRPVQRLVIATMMMMISATGFTMTSSLVRNSTNCSVKAMMRISRDFKMTDTINYERNMFEIVMAN